MDPVFEQPDAYELAFSFREIEREVDFLVDVARRRLGRAPTSAVELGAGPASHGRALAARGLTVYAVDRSGGAVAWLRDRAPEVVTVLADLTDFHLPAPVDLAFSPLATFGYLLDDEAWLAALAAAAESLVPGGALVLELAPGDAGRDEVTRWSVTRDGETAEVVAGPSRAVGDGVFEWELSVTLAGETLAGLQRQRAISPAGAAELIRRSGRYSPADSYADYDRRRRWRGEPTGVVVAWRT